jgi:hypothetical protein
MLGVPPTTWYSELGKGGDSHKDGSARRGSSGPLSAVPSISAAYASTNLLKNPGSSFFAAVSGLSWGFNCLAPGSQNNLAGPEEMITLLDPAVIAAAEIGTPQGGDQNYSPHPFFHVPSLSPP